MTPAAPATPAPASRTPRGCPGRTAADRADRATRERCELCSVALDADHRHLADTTLRVLACTCLACALLFEGEGAGGGRFRAVPDRVLADPAWDAAAVDWAALRVPAGLAFFLRDSSTGGVVALRPGPAGVAESAVEPGVWQAELGASALARALADDVEALLVRRSGAHATCLLVPVDTAYALAGLLRRHGGGPCGGGPGGPRVRAEVDAFFDRLTARAVSVATQEGSHGP